MLFVPSQDEYWRSTDDESCRWNRKFVSTGNPIVVWAQVDAETPQGAKEAPGSFGDGSARPHNVCKFSNALDDIYKILLNETLQL